VGRDVAAGLQLVALVDEVILRFRKFSALNRMGMWQLKGMNLQTALLETSPVSHWQSVLMRVRPSQEQKEQILACYELCEKQMEQVIVQRRQLAKELDALVTGTASSMDVEEGAPATDGATHMDAATASGAHVPAAAGALLSPAGPEDLPVAAVASGSSSQALPLALASPTATPATAAAAAGGGGTGNEALPRSLQFWTPILWDYQPLLTSLHENMSREHLMVNMLMYALTHVLSHQQVAKAFVSSWPYWPDVAAMVGLLKTEKEQQVLFEQQQQQQRRQGVPGFTQGSSGGSR